jgi:hypothetical protein
MNIFPTLSDDCTNRLQRIWNPNSDDIFLRALNSYAIFGWDIPYEYRKKHGFLVKQTLHKPGLISLQLLGIFFQKSLPRYKAFSVSTQIFTRIKKITTILQKV